MVGSIIQTFACYHAPYDKAHPLVIYGETGTLQVPDPNTFDGTVLLRGAKDEAFREMPMRTLTFVKGYGPDRSAPGPGYGVRAAVRPQASRIGRPGVQRTGNDAGVSG